MTIQIRGEGKKEPQSFLRTLWQLTDNKYDVRALGLAYLQDMHLGSLKARGKPALFTKA